MLTINGVTFDPVVLIANPVPSPSGRFNNLIGDRHKWLEVVAYAGTMSPKPGARKRTYWLCRCDCGKYTLVSRDNWRAEISSCGCYYVGRADPLSPETRECSKCHRRLPRSKEFFHAVKEFGAGLDSECKDCSGQISRKNQQKLRTKWRTLVLDHYGLGEPRCECCGERREPFLTIDHVNGGGNRHRKQRLGNFYYYLVRQNFPTGYRLLCMNCNFSLGIRGYCPHQRERDRSHDYAI